MSVHGMKPSFTTYQGYQEWRAGWRELYSLASEDIRRSKNRIKDLQRAGESSAAQQREHHFKRVTARKLMTVLDEAKIRWENIRNMRRGIQEQMKEFPLTLEAKNIDFHFNKKSNEFDFIPMWVVKAKGKSYYCHSVVSSIGFSTRETPDHPSTKGSIRFKKGTLRIDENGVAYIG